MADAATGAFVQNEPNWGKFEVQNEANFRGGDG